MSRIGDSNAGGNAGAEAKGEQGGQGSAGSVMERAQEVGNQLRDMGQQARQAAQDQYGQLRDQATEYYQQGREKAVEWEQGLEQYVQEKPLQSLLIAAGVGVLLGVLWKRS